MNWMCVIHTDQEPHVSDVKLVNNGSIWRARRECQLVPDLSFRFCILTKCQHITPSPKIRNRPGPIPLDFRFHGSLVIWMKWIPSQSLHDISQQVFLLFINKWMGWRFLVQNCLLFIKQIVIYLIHFFSLSRVMLITQLVSNPSI